MAGRVVSAGGWLIGMSLVIRHLSAAEQGFYYAFQSLIALQVLLEMGMSTVVLTSAAHEVAELRWDGTWTGPSAHLERLGSLARIALKWFGGAAILVLGLILPIGIAFFGRHQVQGQPISWFGPWIFLSVAAATSVFVVGLNALTEGIGAVSEMAMARLLQSTCGLLAFAVAISKGAGLWSGGIMVGTGVLVSSSFILMRVGPRLASALQAPRGEPVNWRQDLLPFQWRIALSWMAGYAIFQVLTPTVFAYNGPAEAGRFGLAVQATSGIGTIAGAWIQVRQTPWAMAAARGDVTFMDRDFRRVSWTSVILAALGCGAVAILALLAGRTGFAHRIPAWGVLLPFFIAICVNQYIFAMATYLRSFRVEPFLGQSWAMAGTILTGCFLLRRCPVTALAWWYCGAVVTVGLNFALWIFRNWRKKREGRLISPQ